jgi:hypothetical protein
MVSRATSDMLIGADWALNMEVVDFLNRSDKKLQQSVASALNHRLRYADSHVRDLTLTLTDTCMKNCGAGFHTFLSDVGFGQTLADIVVRNEEVSCSPRVRNKMLGLIQEWKDAVSEDAGDFQRAFDTLKFKQNISFPFPKTKSVPINTPPARYATKESKEEEANQAAIAAILRESTESSQAAIMSSSLEHQTQTQSGSSPNFVVFNQGHHPAAAAFPQGSTTNVVYNVNNLNVRPAQEMHQHQSQQEQRTSAGQTQQQLSSGSVTVAKTVNEELDTISNSCVLLKDMLEAVDNSNKAAIRTALSDDLMSYLLSQCKIGKESSSKWIPSLQDEVTLQKALSLNDDIDFCMMLHESLQSAMESKEQAMEDPMLDNVQNNHQQDSSSHDLYNHIFSKKSDQGSSSSSMASAETKFVENQSDSLELKDISIDSKMPARQTSSETLGLDLDLDLQPDLISFDDNTPKCNQHEAAPNHSSATPAVVPAAFPKQKQITGTSKSQDSQSSRFEDLLSL